MRLMDTHAHLSDLEDREGVIERARGVGIDAIIAVGGNLETSRATLSWADDYGGYVHPALGIHPTEWMGDDVDETRVDSAPGNRSNARCFDFSIYLPV